jgi:hypothetical protein
MARATGLEIAAPGVTGQNYTSNISGIGNEYSDRAGSNAPKVPKPTPPPQRHIVTRQELYDLVWSTPMTKLAAQFGVSGRGLAKICTRAGVPVPKPVYWAKVHAGQSIASTGCHRHANACHHQIIRLTKRRRCDGAMVADRLISVRRGHASGPAVSGPSLCCHRGSGEAERRPLRCR